MTSLTHSSLSRYFRDRPALHNIITNTSWHYSEKIIRLVLGFFIMVLMARSLGPDTFGLISFALALATLFVPVVRLGLDKIAIREIVQSSNSYSTVLGTSFSLMLLMGIVCYLVLLTIVFQLRPDDATARLIILIISSMLFFQAFDVVSFWYDSQVRSKFYIIPRAIGFIIGSAIKIVLLLTNASSIKIAMAISFEIFLVATLMLFVYNAESRSISNWKLDFNKAKSLLSDSWPLILAALSAILYARIDQVMIGYMIDDATVAYYTVAVRMAEFWYFIPTAIIASVTPALIRSNIQSKELYNRRITLLYELLILLAIIAGLFFTFFGNTIITYFFGIDYVDSARVLTIYIWSGIAVVLGGISGQYLVNENYTKISFYRTLIGAIVNIVLNLVLIPEYGSSGAAVASFISFFVATFSMAVFKKTRSHCVLMLKAFIPVNLVKFLITTNYNGSIK